MKSEQEKKKWQRLEGIAAIISFSNILNVARLAAALRRTQTHHNGGGGAATGFLSFNRVTPTRRLHLQPFIEKLDMQRVAAQIHH